MIIKKETFTEIALSFIEPHKEYDRDYVIQQTAIEITNLLHEQIGFGSMSVQAITKMREAFTELARNTIDWARLNRKRDPEEYADLVWRLYASDEEVIGNEEV